MENQKYRGDAAVVILDTYGKITADDVMHGFDEETKQKIQDSLKKPVLEKKQEPGWYAVRELFEKIPGTK